MNKLLIFATMVMLLISCSNSDKKAVEKDNKIALHADTLNVVRLTDTLVIYESTCRGCAYETSTSFDISDTAGIIKMHAIITTDNSAPGTDGGNISKDIILVPQKTGSTVVKLFRFLKPDSKDSTDVKLYSIEVKN